MAKKTRKLSDYEIEKWNELYAYIEKEYFNYDDNQKLQKNAVLRLKGLSNGKLFANNNVKNNGNYGPDVLLMAFKMYKHSIVPYMNKKDFDSEERKMTYCCACIRDKLNIVYQRMKRAEIAKKQEDNVDTTVIDYDGVKYKDVSANKQSKTVQKHNKHKELW